MNTEVTQIGGVDVEIVRKKIKNLHIGCYPPDGRVRVAAPNTVGAGAIRMAVLTRMPWIKRKQAQFAAQDRQPPRQYISGETHYLFGRPLRLSVTEVAKTVHRITAIGADRLLLEVPADSSHEQRQRWMDNWYKAQLRRLARPRIVAWSTKMGVAPEKWGIRPMKTKWGSCNPDKRIIWLNLELAKKPEHATDYVIVHELAHFISPTHDATFIAVLDKEVPSWRQIRRDLNFLPLAAWR